MSRFRDRAQAGQELAQQLQHLANRHDVIVLGLARGGVPVAAEVVGALKAPLDVFVVRKLGVPGHEELAVGAIAGGGTCVINENVRHNLGLSDEAIARVIAVERAELRRRETSYRGERSLSDLTGRLVVLVDDGLATGASMRAAVLALRARQPGCIVVAVPVAPRRVCDEVAELGVEMVCLVTPAYFGAVGRFYEDFAATTDEEVRMLLDTK